jgi:hypothetical protein
MRIFNHFNQSNDDICPICRTNEDKETVLIPIPGTEEGNLLEAIQMHLDCLKHVMRCGLLCDIHVDYE